MLSKAKKLNSTEHKEVLSFGKKIHSPFFSLHYLKKNENDSKYAVVVPKRVAKKAVKRNKNKRKVFDIIEKIYPHIVPGYLFILTIRIQVEDMTQVELQEELETIFKSFLN